MSTAAKTFSAAQARGKQRFSGELWLGLALAGLLIIATLASDSLQPADPAKTNLLGRFTAPGTDGYWFGSDNLGRDLLARVLAGLQWSLSAAALATAISACIGTTLGLIAAEYSGRVRTIILQLTDLVLAFPGLIVAICVIAVVGQGFWPLVLTLGLLSWPAFARVIYAEGLSLANRGFVTAARLSGSSRASILIRHWLPALSGTLGVMLAFHFAEMLIAESALSFLGLAAPVGEPTWGNMLAESRPHLFRAPWMLYVPAGAIVIAVLAANFIGDGLAHLFGRSTEK